MPRVTYPIAGLAKLLAPGAASRRHLRIYRDNIREQHGEGVEATELGRRRETWPHFWSLGSNVEAVLTGRVFAWIYSSGQHEHITMHNAAGLGTRRGDAKSSIGRTRGAPRPWISAIAMPVKSDGHVVTLSCGVWRIQSHLAIIPLVGRIDG